MSARSSGAVPLLGELGRAVQDLPGGVDLVDVVDALQDGRHPLQAHPGVDVAERQRARDVEVGLAAHRAELVLHEDEVPHLQVAVLVRFRAAVPAVLRAAVVVDLRAGAAGTGDPHAPVVVSQAAALDPALRELDHIPPDLVGLHVLGQDGGPEPVLREAEPAVVLGPGQQLPGVRDRHVLEVVAERPVAQHLEERRVPGGPADFLDVEGPHALLHVRRPLERRGLLAEQVRLERLHPGDDEQHRRIVGHQAGRGDDRVPVLLEISQEAARDLCRLHQRPSFTFSTRPRGRPLVPVVPGAPVALGSLARLGPGWPCCRFIYRSMPSRTSRANRPAALT